MQTLSPASILKHKPNLFFSLKADFLFTQPVESSRLMCACQSARHAKNPHIFLSTFPGSLIAARAKDRSERSDADLAALEGKIDRDEDPSEVWLRQIARPNRVSSTNIASKRGLFEELKAKTENSWETRR